MTEGGNFAALSSELANHGADLHPSELHGMLIGYLCASKRSEKEHRAAIYGNWLGESATKKMSELLDEAYLAAAEALDEYSDFDFRLLLPDDDEHINERVRSLAFWCSGFLSGFGEAGRPLTMTGDVGEAFEDLAKIAALSEEVPDSEENEVDLAEIEEYVRVSALLIYSETVSPSAH